MLPGDYTLYVRYYTQVSPALEGWYTQEDGLWAGFLQTAPLRLKVVE